MHIMQVWRSAR